MEVSALQIDSNLVVNICGSYRRRALDSGDIDVLINHKNIDGWKDIEESNTILKEIILPIGSS